MATVVKLAQTWYELFNRHAGDLYPERYTEEKCRELAEQAIEIKARAHEKGSMIVAHNYLYPEFHEIADMVGDSLGLSLHVQKQSVPRVDFQSVFFMGATAKIIVGDTTRVFVSDSPEVLGCSLVFGTDYEWLHRWKTENPGGVLVTYINSDAYTKSISDYISTSRNTDKVIVRAAEEHPGKKILVLPDKYLGFVMKAKAVEQGVNPDLVDVYNVRKGEFRSACYVHEQIGPDAPEMALFENEDDAELMIHPECGCASSCLYKLNAGIIPRAKAYFLSTEQMVERARMSPTKTFIVATEKGMIYRLRKEMPEKKFVPVSMKAECRFMKANTFEKLLRSLREDRLEIVLCDNCCDPKHPYRDERVIHIQRSVAEKAGVAINRMLSIR
ncbi:MAG: quinolinate synthase NadA [Parcubacteria group bacterium]|nr:quinolinate synthase NadA [Parcubacteria group bacterium]